MNQKMGERLVGWLFHFVERGIKDMITSWVRPKDPTAILTPKLPVVWWVVYAAVFGLVAYYWPENKVLPNEMWIGILSFEAVLAALLAAVGRATVTHGVVPLVVTFWSSLDTKLGEKLANSARQARDELPSTAAASPFRNAWIVSLINLFVLPLPLFLDARWTAAILMMSLIWTARRLIPDAMIFIMTEYAPVIPTAYWVTRSWHEQLAYCPVCKGEPQTPTWPPARPNIEAAASKQD